MLKTCQDDRFLYSKPVTKIKLKRVISSILFRNIILTMAGSLLPNTWLQTRLSASANLDALHSCNIILNIVSIWQNQLKCTSFEMNRCTLTHTSCIDRILVFYDINASFRWHGYKYDICEKFFFFSSWFQICIKLLLL